MKWLSGILFLLYIAPVFGGRPLATEDAVMTPNGVWEAEVSHDVMRWQWGCVDHAFLISPFYGVSDRLNIAIGLPLLINDPPTGKTRGGLGDIDVTAKYLLTGGKRYPAVAIKAVVKTATGDARRNLGTGAFDYATVLSATQGMGATLLHAMFGYSYIDRVDHRVIYGLAAEIPLNSTISLATEISGDRNIRRLTDHTLAATVGSAITLSDLFILDTGVQIGLTDAVPTWNAIIGATITF